MEYPKQRVVIAGSENFGDECSAGCQESDGEGKGGKDEERLLIGIRSPGGADVGRAVVEDAI